MFKILKDFKASENGIKVDSYLKGEEYDELPAMALKHGTNIEAIEKVDGEKAPAKTAGKRKKADPDKDAVAAPAPDAGQDAGQGAA